METTELQGHNFSAKFVAEIMSRTHNFGNCESGDCWENIYFWRGQGEITDKDDGKSWRFLFQTEWCKCSNCEHLQSLGDGLMHFFRQKSENSWDRERVSIAGLIVDRARVIDVFCQQIIAIIEEAESNGTIIVNLILPKIFINQLVAEGAVAESDGQVTLDLS